MDQMQDSIADQHHRRPPRSSHFYLGCFGGASEEDEKPQRKPKSISQSGWFSCSRLRRKKFPKRTVPVDSATDDQKLIIHEISAPPNKPSTDQLPAKGDDKNQTQPSDAGQVLIGKAKKTRSGKSNILLGNSKSMNHIQSLKYSHGASSSLRKCTSAKSTTSTSCSNISLINQPASIGLSMAVENSQPPVSSVQPLLSAALTDRGDSDGVILNKTVAKNKGCFDRVVGISFIVMVLLIMVVWGKVCAILCFSIWLYFYPLLVIAKKGQDVGQTKNSKSSFELHTNSLGYDKKKVVFQGFLQRDHHII